MEPPRALASTLIHEEYLPFDTTLCFLILITLVKKLICWQDHQIFNFVLTYTFVSCLSLYWMLLMSDSYWQIAPHFFMDRDNTCFFLLWRKMSFFRYDLEIISSGSQIERPQFCSMRKTIMSCHAMPIRALLGFRF